MEGIIELMAAIRQALNNLPSQDSVYFDDAVGNTFR